MMQRRVLIIGSVLGSCLVVHPVYSQIIPDSTTNTSVLNNCHNSCKIIGGTVAEQNLFHSFQKFNVAPDARVYFADPGVGNIFSRITGSNPSEIFGTLGVLGGDANLFLLNPNGIIFGKGVSLDLNGSFFATTADEIQFGDRGSFAADSHSIENLALLTVDPSALFFNRVAQNGSILLEGAELTVPAQQDITLLGRAHNDPGILLKNSTINVSEGNIALGAVRSNAKIGIRDNVQLQFPDDVVRSDITLAETSSIAATNSDNAPDKQISINADNLEIRDDSNISTIATGIGNGANLNIDARESVKIIGKDDRAFQQFLVGNLTPGGNTDFAGSGLQTTALGTGNAGDITITTSDLTIAGGAGIISTTRAWGTTGNISLDVADTFLLRDSGLLTGSGTFTLGRVGEIKIDTDFLLLERGGIISSSTLGNGNAGNLTIEASDLVQIGATPPESIIPTGIFTNTIFGNGRGGNLKIDTRRLILQNGGQLSSSSGAITRDGLIPLGGPGGNIFLKVSDSLRVGGVSNNGIFHSSILSDTRSNSSGGNLNIDTGTLVIDPKGFVSASSIGTGMGGNIRINASDSIILTGTGIDSNQQLFVDGLTGQLRINSIREGLVAFTISEGNGGNITIDTPLLGLESGAILATSTLGNGNAGNLEIAATDRIDVIGSVIAAPTFGAGNAGIINIGTKDLSLLQGGAIASASIGSGSAGDLKITATESVEVYTSIPNLLFSGSISTGSYKGFGSPGDLTIDTQRLSIENGANIQANNASIDLLGTNNIPSVATTVSDSRGKLTINASESIEISGSSSQNIPFSDTSSSHISSTTSTSAAASDVLITTANLSLFDGGEISVNSLGDGAAGKLEVVADYISLRDEGNLNGTTNSGKGGNIVLQVDNILRVEDNSSIDTDAIALGDGGNIDITANFVVASGNSSISANAAAMGNGGNINITAKDLFLTFDSKITADSALGIDGTIEIKTLTDTEQSNYTELPQKVIQADQTIVQSCSNSSNRSGIFSYTGRGGLPSNPLTEFQANNMVIADFEIPQEPVLQDPFEDDKMMLNVAQPKIIEANRWQINANGKVELIASTDRSSQAIKSNHFNCPLSSYK